MSATSYRVITLRGRWPACRDSVFVYVGRAWAGLDDHPLANPFKGERAVEQYREWLRKHPNFWPLMRDLRADTECGRHPLACWCGDGRVGSGLQCHAMVLAEAMATCFPDDVEGSEW